MSLWAGQSAQRVVGYIEKVGPQHDIHQRRYLDRYHCNFPKLEIHHYNSSIHKHTITIHILSQIYHCLPLGCVSQTFWTKLPSSPSLLSFILSLSLTHPPEQELRGKPLRSSSSFPTRLLLPLSPSLGPSTARSSAFVRGEQRPQGDVEAGDGGNEVRALASSSSSWRCPPLLPSSPLALLSSLHAREAGCGGHRGAWGVGESGGSKAWRCGRDFLDNDARMPNRVPPGCGRAC
jgi:hypothetical protein